MPLLQSGGDQCVRQSSKQRSKGAFEPVSDFVLVCSVLVLICSFLVLLETSVLEEEAQTHVL